MKLVTVLVFTLLASQTSFAQAPIDLGQDTAWAMEALLDPAVDGEVAKIKDPTLKIHSVYANHLNDEETTYTYNTLRIDPQTGAVVMGGMKPPRICLLRKVILTHTSIQITHQACADSSK